MSVAEFSDTLQNYISSEHFRKFAKSNPDTIISKSAKALRSGLQTAERTDFEITSKEVDTILGKFLPNNTSEDKAAFSYASKEILKAIADNGRAEFNSKKSKLGTGPRFTAPPELIPGTTIYKVTYEKIGFDTISEIINRAFNPFIGDIIKERHQEDYEHELQVLKSKYATSSKEYKKGFKDLEKLPEQSIGSFFHKGHLISVAANLLTEYKNLLQRADASVADEKKGRDKAVQFLEKTIQKLIKEDINTANKNSVEYDAELATKYLKNTDRLLVQMQLGEENIKSGTESAPVVDIARQIFTGSLPQIVQSLKAKEIIEDIVGSEGSPSFINLQVSRIISVIKGISHDKKTYVGSVKTKLPKVKVLATKSSNKNKIKAIKDIVRTIKKLPATKNTIAEKLYKEAREGGAVGSSLISLEALLRARINEQVKQNMGTGNDKKVLNYRTGRLAESVSIERLSESRAGMVSVFYNYMRNPYGTFSEGGRQQYPRTRDPKLLISKSIREIGAAIVGTRMRAVLV